MDTWMQTDGEVASKFLPKILGKAMRSTYEPNTTELYVDKTTIVCK